MASLPSVLVGNNTLKLEPDFKKHLPTTSLSVQQKGNYNNKTATTQLVESYESVSLDFREALSVIQDGSSGFESNVYIPILQECMNNQSVSQTQMIHAHIIKTGTFEDLYLMTFVVNVYGKCGAMDLARKLFDDLPKKNVVTWTSLMSGYIQSSEPMVAIRVFSEMLEDGTYPTNYTLGVVLHACTLLLSVKLGEQLHGFIVKYQVEDDTSIGNALSCLYSKCRSLDSAVKAFSRTGDKNVISWTTAISACGDNGDSVMGLSLFTEMLYDGIEPNEYTFTSVLKVCCFMQAMGVGSQMEFEPNEFIWSNLIAGCRSHGNLELAYYAAEQLLNLNPKDCETYVLLLNMYLSAGKYQDVSRVKKRMKIEKVGKLKDWSWISVRDKVHSFKPDDRLCPPGGEVDLMLADLLEKARTIGYEAQGSFGVTDEEGLEQTTSKIIHHSEKLAVAYGLLNAPNESPIRVIKSISMCSDCHSFIKLISVITEREIIIRDSKRLHKFVNGKCSCGDFGSLM
uniref:DYW domain-containing protein n=1 Tax=Daucus carota subsp. sativus TaxID=79200 RepID=A0A165ZA50_DAUCS